MRYLERRLFYKYFYAMMPISSQRIIGATTLLLDDSMAVQLHKSTQLLKLQSPGISKCIPNEILCFEELNTFLGHACTQLCQTFHLFFYYVIEHIYTSTCLFNFFIFWKLA